MNQSDEELERQIEVLLNLLEVDAIEKFAVHGRKNTVIYQVIKLILATEAVEITHGLKAALDVLICKVKERGLPIEDKDNIK